MGITEWSTSRKRSVIVAFFKNAAVMRGIDVISAASLRLTEEPVNGDEKSWRMDSSSNKA